jgi:hypothetical protein
MVYHCRSHALRRVLFTLDIGVAPLGVTAFVRVLARAALASNSKILSPTFRSNHHPRRGRFGTDGGYSSDFGVAIDDFRQAMSFTQSRFDHGVYTIRKYWSRMNLIRLSALYPIKRQWLVHMKIGRSCRSSPSLLPFFGVKPLPPITDEQTGLRVAVPHRHFVAAKQNKEITRNYFRAFR